jgi:hypothetical protein
MREILVIANRTLGGRKLLDRVRELASEQETRFRLVVPQSKPSSGLVIYDEVVRDSAQVRIDLAVSLVGEEGIQASGAVGDQDPFLAAMDAIAERRPSAVIVSTHPVTHSGWLRRDLIERIENASGLPVEHIVTDLEQEGLSFRVTLVIANQTAGGEDLIERLREKAADGERHLFIAVVPQQRGHNAAVQEARQRLDAMLERLRAAELPACAPPWGAAGMIGDPDPYTATMNALELFRVDDIVISTLPNERSGWLRANLIERIRGATAAPVEHVVVGVSETATAAPAAAGS